MKRSIFFAVLLMCALANASAQSVKTPQSSEQSLQELVSEVRQLRATLQRMNAAVYKGQVLLERLKLQQEQVFRLSRELAETRDNLSEARARQIALRDTLRRFEAAVQAGVKHSDEAMNLKGELDESGQRQHRLAMRESQLANELQAERAKLNQLNDQLNALVEIEMTPK